MILYRLADAIRHRIQKRRWTHDRALGVRGEDIAHRFLRKRKFIVVARNYRAPSGAGEIDLIAWENGTLAFIEVKTRSNDDTSAPDRNVDRYKRKHLEHAARHYALRAKVEWERTRFDIVTVLVSSGRVELFRDAFGATRTI